MARKIEKNNTPRVAIVCDWLIEIGGAEAVVKVLHELYPEAPIFCSVCRKSKVDAYFEADRHTFDVRTGKLNYAPLCLRKFLGIFRERYYWDLDLSGYDVVISVTGAEAKAASAGKGKLTICYCHVPTQYYWGKYDKYLENPGFGVMNVLARAGLKQLVGKRRSVDLAAAARPDHFVTISSFARSEIKKYYRRDAKVIYPPVDLKKFKKVVKKREEQRRKYYNIIKQYKSQEKSNHRYDTKGNKNQEKSNQHINIKYEKVKSSESEHNIYEFHNPVENFGRTRHFEHKYVVINRTQFAAQVQNIIAPDGRYVKNALDSQKLTPASVNLAAPVNYYINYSRQVNWKCLDLAVAAAIQASQPLVLVGDGPEHRNLVKLARQLQKNSKNFSEKIYDIDFRAAGSSPAKPQKSPDARIEKIGLVTFISAQPQERLASLLTAAKAFLFTSVEPFGIAPVEALASGTPVIALKDGGALDFISPENGLFFDRPTPDSLCQAILKFETMLKDPRKFRPASVSKTVERFSTSRFKSEMKEFVREKLKK